MLRLLGRFGSINVRKALCAAEEAGVALAHEAEWGADGPGARALTEAGFRALNPNGLVPVLLGAGAPLWESHAIMRFLAETGGAGALRGGDARGRAAADQWLDWLATELNPAWRPAYLARIKGAAFPAEAAAASERDWNARMALLDGALAETGAWIAGETFTLADIALGLAAHRWRMTPIARPDLPAVADWLARLDARPAFARCAPADLP